MNVEIPRHTATGYAFFVRRRIATTLLAMGLFVFGVTAFIELPVSALPDVEYPTIIVEGFMPGASADTMATAVAAPLEKQLGTVTGVISMVSTNTPGVAHIEMRFELGRNMSQVSAELQSDIDAATTDLPPDILNVPGWYIDNPSDTSVFVVALTSDLMPLTQVDLYGDAAVARRATLIPGVRKSANYARGQAAIRIDINPRALTARGLSMEDVRAAIRATSVDQATGKLDDNKTISTLSTNGQITDVAGYQNLVIATHGLALVRLKDVANVSLGIQDEDQIGFFNNDPAVAFGFKRAQGANIVQTVDNIRDRLPDMQAALPPGVKLHVAVDRSKAVRRAIHDIEVTLVFTTLLVVGTIFAFLRRVWATLIPSITIPLSILATFFVMHALGYTLDNLSLMALTVSVGFVVDDAIVVIENIARHVEEGASPMQAAIDGVREVGFTILSITLSLVAVFIPVLFMGGLVGRLFREFGVTISAAVLISAVIALTVVPMMAGMLFTPQPARRSRDRGVLAAMTRQYGRSLDWFLARKYLALTLFVAITASTAYLFVIIPKGFLPPQSTGVLSGSIEMDPDVALPAQGEITQQAVAVVLKDPAIESAVSYRDGRMLIQVSGEAAKSEPIRDIVARIKGSVSKALPGIKFYLRPQAELALSSWVGHAEYQYSLTDPDRAELADWAPRLTQGLQELPGLTNVNPDEEDYGREVHVEINRDLASRLGVSASDVAQTLYDAFGQRRVRKIYSDAGQSYVIMQVAPEFQHDEDAIAPLYVRSSSNHLVRLDAVTTVQTRSAALTVKHKDQLPALSVSFDLRPGVSLGDAVNQIRTMEAAIGKPIALQTAFEGAAGEFEKSLRSEPFLIGASVLVVYIVLGIMYESFLDPLVILSALPLAGPGALLMLMETGYDLSMIAVVGMLLLIGIVKKNSIMMLDFATSRRREGASAATAIRDAAVIRFRPIMMTTIAALVGTLPLAIGTGTGFELRRPLGLCVVGGLLLSQFLTLYFTPPIYVLVDRLKRKGPVTVGRQGLDVEVISERATVR